MEREVHVALVERDTRMVLAQLYRRRHTHFLPHPSITLRLDPVANERESTN